MKRIVIKLGGSLISISDDKQVNYEYLDKLKTTLQEFINEGYEFAVVVGGGHLCRVRQDWARKNSKLATNRELDWIGVATINLNAEMIRAHWADIACDKVVRYDDYKSTEQIEMEKPILICAAEEPGHSSDVDAVKIAKRIGTNILYRLTNVDAIYTSDPKSNPDAQPIHKLTWDKYFEVLGINEFTPGGHYPVDPVASKMSNEADLIFYLMDGENLENFSRSLRGEDFKGSIITNTVSEI
ncbi:MAG TPA: hypothetical protein VGA67_02310 [Candidatus Dojkabacteria bacterium]|jgi:uridylate kinase